MLTGPTVEFRWTGGVGASQYWLFVGTTPGGTDIINLDTGTGRSLSVANIPSDGRPVYVRLWSLVGGEWAFRDYTYSTTLPF